MHIYMALRCIQELHILVSCVTTSLLLTHVEYCGKHTAHHIKILVPLVLISGGMLVETSLRGMVEPLMWLSLFILLPARILMSIIRATFYQARKYSYDM